MLPWLIPRRQQGVPFGKRQIAARQDVPAGWEEENTYAGKAATSQSK